MSFTEPSPSESGAISSQSGGNGAPVTSDLESARRSVVSDEGLQSLSPSRASDFKQCPQLFKFRSIDRLPEPTSIYQARGTTAHLALERLFDLPAPDRNPERLYDLFREAWTELRTAEEYSELFESLDDERLWGVESLSVLSNYYSLENPSDIDPFDRELDLLEELDGITIRGILDRIDERPDGELVITDYKTGKAPPERYALSAFFALKIYALLVRNRIGRTPVELRLLYLGNATLYSIPIDDTALNGMERQLRALWGAINRAIERSNFPPRTSVLCNWCSFQDICPAFEGVEIADGPNAARPEPAAVT